ncbi:MAG: hypothetical protein ABWZ83_02915 [Mesorhizobium sp.]
MPATDLMPGLRHKETVHVDESLVVPAMADRFAGFSDMPPVFATAFVVGLVEWTCVEALKSYLARRSGRWASMLTSPMSPRRRLA